MPIGFAKSILAQGTTATGNSFTTWDGSNDTTFTTTTTTKHFIGFAPFDNEYGVLISAKDSGTNDKIQYDVIRNQSGTLSITDGGNEFISTGSSNYTSLQGLVAPAQDGSVIYDSDSTGENQYHKFTISSGTVTRNDGGTSNRTMHTRPLFVDRAADSTGYNNLDYSKRGETIATGNHFETSETVSTESSSNVSLFYGDGRCVPGFVDKDTPFWLNSTDSGETLQPFKIDLQTAGSQTPTTFSGSPTNSTTMTQFDSANSTFFSSNTYEFDQFATPMYNSTSFNDIAIMPKREGGGLNPNKMMFETYKAGDASVARSNICTLSTTISGDASGTGCFVGDNNDVFLFAAYQVSAGRIFVLRYVHSTNTLTEILNFSETLPTATGAEEVRLHRWFNQGALMTIGNTKIRFIQA